MSHREHFGRLVRSPIVPLAEACFVMAAQLGHPDPVADGLASIEALTDEAAAAVARELGPESAPSLDPIVRAEDSLKPLFTAAPVLVNRLYRTVGLFRGNES